MAGYSPSGVGGMGAAPYAAPLAPPGWLGVIKILGSGSGQFCPDTSADPCPKSIKNPLENKPPQKPPNSDPNDPNWPQREPQIDRSITKAHKNAIRN